MARRTPFYAHLTNIVSKNRSCPSGSSMVAGKCVTETPTPATSKPVSVGLLSRTQTPAKSIEYPTKISVGITRGSSRPTQTIVTMGTSISSDQISAIKEKISAMSLPETSPGNVHIGSGRSTSGVLPTAQKAIAGPTITLARPSEERSTPNTANPNKYVPVTEAKPLTVVGSGSTAIPESSDATGFIFRGIPIKM